MDNVIKLIYDRYENDVGFINGTYGNDRKHKKFESINDKRIKNERELNIYTWGIKKHKCDRCDIIFDATLLTAKINKDVRNVNGKNDIVKQSIINHPKFDIMIETILTNIENDEPLNVGFICNYGKHRSVAFAEVLKMLYYPNAKITHFGL